MSSRSNSARPPRTVRINRPCGVVVSAHASASDLKPERLLARLAKDKKTIRGSVHFVLATGIGSTEVVSGLDDAMVLEAIGKAIA